MRAMGTGPLRRGRTTPDWTPREALRESLRPFVDLDEVGPEGLETWLLSILPTLVELRGRREISEGVTVGSEARILELATKLAFSESERSRDHFLAVQYYRDNTLLARRVKALEGAIRLAQRTGKPPVLRVPEEEDETADRYLPHGGTR
jgi:hypothetical protein